MSKRVQHLVGDLFYSKLKWIQGLKALVGLHAVSKLRQDANVNYLYHGPQSTGPGRKKKYAGKVI